VADFEFHFPEDIAIEYTNSSPNIFDSPPVFGIDEYYRPHAVDAFIEIYYYVRKKFIRRRIPQDIAVYHFVKDDATNELIKKEYDVSCSLNRAFMIDRLITAHAVLTYRHPIASYMHGLTKDVNEFTSFSILNEALNTLKKLNVPFTLITGNDYMEKGRFKLLINYRIKSIAPVSNYYSPLSLSSQLIYALARFISDNALVNEHLCADIKAACEFYEKKCKEEFERIKVELDKILNADKLIKAVEFVLSKTPYGDGKLFIPLEIDDLVEQFNKDNDCDLSVQAVIDKMKRLQNLGKIHYEGGRWRVRV